MGAEFLGAGTDRRRAVRLETVHDLRSLHRPGYSRVQFPDDGGRHLGAGDHSVPLIELVAGHPGFREGSKLRHGGRTLLRSDREEPQAVGAHVRPESEQVCEPELDVARRNGDHRTGR